ncbi:MAG: hypothetical protein RL026_814 [Pseudomonadota bacterium]|jgi:hypothetical protein
MLQHLNWLAVLAATLSCFVIGGLWYSPLGFMKLWQRENGGQQAAQASPLRVFGIAGACAFMAAVAYAVLIPPAHHFPEALHQGLLTGFGIAAMGFGINYQFSNRSLTLLAIDGGFVTVMFAAYGVILGLWR